MSVIKKNWIHQIGDLCKNLSLSLIISKKNRICRYQRNKCDLNIQWRLQNIPTNAVLEMHKLENRRQTDDVNVQLQLPDNSRYPGWFEPTVTLQEMLDWYRFQPDRFASIKYHFLSLFLSIF